MLSGATAQPSTSGRAAGTSWAGPCSRNATPHNRRHVVSATDPAALQVGPSYLATVAASSHVPAYTGAHGSGS
jgi:hypothetical protein